MLEGMKKTTLYMSEKERMLLEMIAKANGVTKTSAFVQALEHDGMRAVAVLEDTEEAGLWIELIDQVRNERIERENNLKVKRREILKQVRPRKTEREKKETHRRWEREYMRRKKLEKLNQDIADVINPSTVSGEDSQ